MKTFRGLLKADGRFVTIQDIRDDAVLNGVYYVSYQKPETSVRTLIQNAVLSLPKSCIIFSSGSLMDQYALEQAPASHQIKTIRIEEGGIDFDKLKPWVIENRSRYFLTDPCMAALLFKAIEFIELGENVAFVGPIPQVHDLSWSFSRDFPAGRRLFEEAQWSLVETSKSGSLSRASTLHPRIFSLLDERVMLAFLQEIAFRTNARLWQIMGIKFIGGGSIARYLNDGKLYGEMPPKLPLSPAQINDLLPLMLKRSVKSNRCYNRIESYVD